MNISRKTFRGFAGMLILAALIIAFINQMVDPEIESYVGRVVRYFSYFTEYSNILVMLWFLNKSILNERIKFLNKESVKGALTLYIIVAGIVFFLVLNKAWNQEGIAKLQSYTLHGFAPIAFILDWIIFDEKGNYKYKDIKLWIVFPIVYLFVALFIGKMIGVYPYPFLDLNKISILEFLNYLVYLVIAFIGLALIIVTIDKLLYKFGILRKSKTEIKYN
ncbi:Pr6Pr family membrane protein [Clostridium baratii]|uniref:Pr6Pr family membrane protein n=1 Tax=Clostridium baratii TaxID=1561 RepID=UPI0030D13193